MRVIVRRRSIMSEGGDRCGQLGGGKGSWEWDRERGRDGNSVSGLGFHTLGDWDG